MTTSATPTEAEKVVAEWREAMEGVTPGPWRPSRFGFQVVSDYPEPAWQSVVELTTIARSEPNAEREMLTQQAIANWIARCSPSGVSGLLALIESQRATIERVERERDEARRLPVIADYIEAQEARRAAEAKLAQAVEALQKRPGSERLAKLVEEMAKESPYSRFPQSRIALAVAANLVRHGRAFTDEEKKQNLRDAGK
ncbi:MULTISPECIES: hypothetical protein [unclassified Bosea (in: a-proteobacteria)]|uniref:hypothetical protein n=1 Tax=unclassified Bosea (in: a-proteobacteria) TaxID=2653178 RepID=UPI000F74FA0A|nr:MULTISPECIES: hypothetical protein [unclassified Bosea (in: a-proteobacteria)]AZO77450.1 hypothetical protein BLM15_07385 [Bosea sp. Tri-49]RXT22312.1 hypothetical protein B5U98_18040 [Bosea sp. Tri-39]RXT32654.1 hypothetical protein B5U99_28885 [Bosea sp. Tri-54]